MHLGEFFFQQRMQREELVLIQVGIGGRRDGFEPHRLRQALGRRRFVDGQRRERRHLQLARALAPSVDGNRHHQGEDEDQQGTEGFLPHMNWSP